MDEEVCYDMPTVMWLLEPVYATLEGSTRSGPDEETEDHIRDDVTDTFEIPAEIASSPKYKYNVHKAFLYLQAAGLVLAGSKPGTWKMVWFEDMDEAPVFDINEISRMYHEAQSKRVGNVIAFR